MRFKVILLNMLFLGVLFNVRSQVVINEVSSFNDSGMGLLDEDGDAEDWIELYNAGGTTVDLTNYKLFDEGGDTFALPSVNLGAGEFLVIIASGKDRNLIVDHWETAVNDTAIWKFDMPSAEPPSNWNDLTFNDAAISSATGGFGYGDGDDNYIVPTYTTSIYLRKTFNVSTPSDISAGILDMDYDDGFVAYLNGVEIARSSNINGTPPTYDSYTTIDHEAQMYNGGDPERFVIDQTLLQSTLVTGQNVLAIQCHNASAFSSDMTIRPFLSFGIASSSNYFYTTPTWFSAGNSVLHTNFKLDKDGEQLTLLNAGNTVVDQINSGAMNLDHSAGRQIDGSPSWVIFDTPTPNATNSSSSGYFGYCSDSLIFSSDAGFYSSSQSISISGSSEIRYTIDGSLPTASSTLFTAPIVVDTTTPIRAACFASGYLMGDVYTNTYFVLQNKNIPVISMTTNPENFWDYNTGIYVDGPGWTAPLPHTGANYWMEWERPVHIEYFDKNGTQQFEQDIATEIFGGWSRTQDQKSLKLKAKGMYGNSRLDYKFFDEKNITSFKQVVLRNSGNDFLNSNLQDGTNQSNIVDKTNIDYQGFTEAVLFINGRYWGIQNIREKINDHFIEDNHGVPTDEQDLLEVWGAPIVGDGSDFWGIHWQITTNDMSVSANYNTGIQNFDMESMIDYFAANLFISNWDWPQNNLKLWRHATGDRKLRYIMYDTDITLAIWNLMPTDSNMISRLRNGSTDAHSEMFSAFLDNTTFRNYFINRSADLMNTIYLPSYYEATLDGIKNTFGTEINTHYARWDGDMWYHDFHISRMRTFMNDRPTYHRDDIEESFGLAKQVDITLDVDPPGTGVIKINTIYPDNLPWTGVYFDGVPVTITAIPNTGYTFDHWEAGVISGSDFNKSITMNVDQNTTFTAYFNGSSVSADLAINEINYNSSVVYDSGDWLELHNYGTADIDISNWVLKDARDYNAYTFPEGTVLSPDEYLVVCEDTNLFKSIYPSVTNFVGQLGYNFSNAGEEIRLYNYNKELQQTLTYDDTAPWDVLADGQGYTLERNDPEASVALASSWEAGCVLGSPGTVNNPGCVVSATTDPTEALDDIILYPNPSNGLITLGIRNDEFTNFNLRVTDSKGMIVLDQPIRGAGMGYTTAIDLSGLAKGIYHVHLISEIGSFVKKVVLY